jgi:hypothetical protein
LPGETSVRTASITFAFEDELSCAVFTGALQEPKVMQERPAATQPMLMKYCDFEDMVVMGFMVLSRKDRR